MCSSQNDRSTHPLSPNRRFPACCDNHLPDWIAPQEILGVVTYPQIFLTNRIRPLATTLLLAMTPAIVTLPIERIERHFGRARGLRASRAAKSFSWI
jgi:hypothetical protein